MRHISQMIKQVNFTWAHQKKKRDAQTKIFFFNTFPFLNTKRRETLVSYRKQSLAQHIIASVIFK